MGVFDDKKIEQLDWMTQITETIESEINGLIARLPDRLEFGAEDVLKQVSTFSHFSLQVDSVVRDLLEKLPDCPRLNWDDQHTIIKCFKFETSPNVEFDLETNTLTGTITLVKIKPTLADEELQVMMGRKGTNALSRINFANADDWPLDRLNEILDILGNCDESKKNRSYRKKMGRITERLKEIFVNNEWRIRDMELADKVGVWVTDYIISGNLAALTNLCKLKVMTHRNMPIYSMEEEK